MHAAYLKRIIMCGFCFRYQIFHNNVNVKLAGGHVGRKRKEARRFGVQFLSSELRSAAILSLSGSV